MPTRTVVVLLLILGYGITGQSQVVRPEVAIPTDLMKSLPFVDVSDPQTRNIPSPETERAQRYDRLLARPYYNPQDPSKSITGRRVSHLTFNGDYDPLPTKDSDVIVVGTILQEVPHLTRGGGIVYTTFDLKENTFIKAGPADSSRNLVLEREGGVVLLHTGEKRLDGIDGMGLPLPGYQYLLFLKKPPNGDSYKIISGYALAGPHVTSLDRVSESLDSLNAQQLIAKVKAKLSNN